MKPTEETIFEIVLTKDIFSDSTMELVRIDWGEDAFEDRITYYINFRTSLFYAGQGVISMIRDRIRFAWLALTKGNFYFHDIQTNRPALEKFNHELTNMLQTETS